MQLLEPIQDILAQYKGATSPNFREVIQDYWICLVSREASLLARKEVLTGKAKFGILGDGKELPQVAMARAFRKGDFRSGYYRDQTFMMAMGLCSIQDYFAQLYADSSNDPFSKGRQMNAHFATAFIDEEGEWTNHTERYNVSADVSSTGGQMARALGLAFASTYYRQKQGTIHSDFFSENGNEVSFCTIGDASTSEGVFWETLNAAAVLQVPLAVCIWDDGYGISVPIHLQTVKQNISTALSGFEASEGENGLLIFKTKGWDYPELVKVFHYGVKLVREGGRPALFHIEEVTQPQGHSTSGSHERYKSIERMQWEQENDCILRMSQWMKSVQLLDEELDGQLKELAKNFVREEKNIAWNNYLQPILKIKDELLEISQQWNSHSTLNNKIDQLKNLKEPTRSELVEWSRNILFDLHWNGVDEKNLFLWLESEYKKGIKNYTSHLYSETKGAALRVPVVGPVYSENSSELNGYQILNLFFDQALEHNDTILAFGEDVGKIGDVNQGFAGLQEKHGEQRVFDTGIREWTIVGQAIGMSMRGLRPIAEIQYLDYIVYGLSALTDDLATLRYRTAGQQKAPAIIRTRGHRLEGIWHSGSPIGMLLHSLRGMYLCVPRNMVQAAGMYNTLLQGDDPAVVIECLNGYRLKEKLPENLKEFTVALGKVELLQSGKDITLVTYGSCIRIAQKAMTKLQAIGIEVELIDAQTLLPFDIDHDIVKSVQKTNKLIVIDEDVPGGASAYILQQILEEQNAYIHLDSKPITLAAKANRPPYGSDGDYFVKPNAEDIIEAVYGLMSEYNPSSFPALSNYK